MENEWENQRNLVLSDQFMGFDEYGRRDIYTNYPTNNNSNYNSPFSSPKRFAVKKSYDNPNQEKKQNGKNDENTDANSGNESDHLSVDSVGSPSPPPNRKKDSYFTYGENGDYKRY